MPNRYGPEERHLLETMASRIYSNVVARGYLASDDPGFDKDSEHRAGYELLIDIGLLMCGDRPGAKYYKPVKGDQDSRNEDPTRGYSN